MGYHFLLGAVVGVASVLILGNRHTKDFLDKGQHLVKNNLDEGIKAFKATGDCIREKILQSSEKSKPVVQQVSAEKKPQRSRKAPPKKAAADE